MAWENVKIINETISDWYGQIPLDNSLMTERLDPASQTTTSTPSPFGLDTNGYGTGFGGYRLRNLLQAVSGQSTSEFWLFGDSQLGIKIWANSSNPSWTDYIYIGIWKNDAQITGNAVLMKSTGWGDGADYIDRFRFFCAINEETQKGTFFVLYDTTHRNSPLRFSIPMGESSTLFWNNSDVYQIIKNAMPITYTWQSVPSISGKNGILSLSHVRDDSLLDGGLQTFTLNQLELSEVSRVGNLMANIPVSQSVNVMYSGFNYMQFERQVGTNISLYLQENFTRLIAQKTSVAMSCYIGFIIDSEQQAGRIGIFVPQYDQAQILTGYSVDFTDTDYSESDVYAWLLGGLDPEDQPDINESDEGTDPNVQPDIAVTGITKPSYGAISTGFTKMYRMSDTQLKALSSFLWSSNFIDNVKKFFNDPREIIVGLSIMPVLPDTGTAEEVAAGGIETGVYGQPLTDQFKLDTYGSCEVKAEKGNFLDFEPFTKITAHLPFVGSHSLNVSDVMGKTLTLKYIFDFLSGSCVAEIDVNDKPHYFFGGSCGIQIPTSSEDFGRMYSSILSAGATVGATLATIATGGLTAPLAIGAGVNMLSNGMNASPTVDFASGSGSINGMIGCKTAFITIERAKEKIVGEQQKYLGRPSYMTRTLSNCTGYTKCMNVHLDNVPCTETERAEIERLLISGIRIASDGSRTPEYSPTSATDHGLIFLKCESDTDVMGKSWDTEHTLTVEGKLMYEQSFLKPVFVVDGDYTAYNYCYIPEFDRFYFITEQIAKTGSITEIRMQVDVLQSWQTQIKTNKAVIERSANKSNNNAYFVDSMYWTQADKEVKTVPFTTATGTELIFTIPEDNYILTIAGGS